METYVALRDAVEKYRVAVNVTIAHSKLSLRPGA
jgi:hypothetical protein